MVPFMIDKHRLTHHDLGLVYEVGHQTETEELPKRKDDSPPK